MNQKSSQLLKPDMLLVLGDVSARGAELTRSNWLSVIQQFHSMLGPFLGLPYHVLLGDRDIGGCSDLNSRSVRWISSKFPGLDSSGCSAFRISNISFVSLNSVPLLCGDNSIRFSVEKTVETESTELQKETEETELKQVAKDVTLKDFNWRKNALSSGSGPVLLLHMPLHLRANNYQDSTMYDENPESIHWDVTRTESRGLAGVDPYELWHTLPPNATEYIFQALKPSSPAFATGVQKSNDLGFQMSVKILKFPKVDGLPEDCENADQVTSRAMLPIFFAATKLLKDQLEQLLEEYHPN
ncbi:Calcineurin-like metallo-phosphoesterase superfamily protein [Heracleum sosnowskyi]|uniref:Calcineurin-like metallo-phosphoesterase superfamily protein n=1 Tax=Heracleum sosnowskyi TaxID=360622 RepID=A0AAD8N1G2_9APIA|nr:Calcineurin-like metallo-phosphoesterase superfamily protein [Heracleum sosnowskyi]